MKHTPGPWEFDENNMGLNNGRPYYGILTLDINIGANARVRINAKNREDECQANARLIAAAPELLEALERMVGVCAGYLENQLPSDADSYNPDYVSPLSQARDAIKKARTG